MKQLIIIQCRVDSSRLPGKALMEIDGKTTLHHVILRCLKANLPTVVATTNRDVDDPIEAVCLVAGVKCYRFPGEANNVLGRFMWVCEKEGFKAGGNQIVRVTADCLGIDSTTIRETLSHLKDSDYAYSCSEFGYPPGHGCEAFTFRALREAHKQADALYDIEHVTPYIQRSFTWVKWRIARYDGFNLELNTKEDYQRIKNIYGHKAV